MTEIDWQKALVSGELIADNKVYLLMDAWQAVLAATTKVFRPLSDKLLAAAEGHLEIQDVFHESNG
jgi:hypothetical protein